MDPRADRSILPPLWVLTAAVAAGLVWLVYALKEMVVLVVVGYSIAYLMDPLLDRLEARGVSRPVGVFALFGVALILLSGLAVTAVPTVVDEAARLIENFPSYYQTARARLVTSYYDLLSRFPADIRRKMTASVNGAFPEFGPETMRSVVSGFSTAILSGYSVTLTILNLALLPFIVFYLAVDFDYVHRAFLSIFPVRRRPAVRRVAAEIHTYVAAFVRGQILVGLIMSVLYAIGLGAIGVELWFLIAVLSGFGNLVPYLGTLVGISVGTLLALATFGDLHHVLYVWGVFAGVQFLEGTYITPKVVGDKVGLSPLTVLLVVFAAGKLLGLLGLFLAVPLAAVIRVTGNEFHQWFLKRIGESAESSDVIMVRE